MIGFGSGTDDSSSIDPPDRSADSDEREDSSAGARIDVRDVSVSFGDVDVLENASLTVEPGEFVGLVGPNGAGKTTLLRTISGALSPTSGTVAVDGADIHALSSKASSRLVAVVPQDTTLSFSFDVRTVVEMGRHPHRSRFSPPTEADREAVERALERTRTAQFADRPIDEVSGGERQRVVLARAIAQDAPVTLLDEPTASLDVNHQVETLELVRDLVAEGRTVVAAIHDLDLAARYCDRLVVLADGSVLEAGPPSDVLSSETLTEAFDASAVVTPNPVTGTETVTALNPSRAASAGGTEGTASLPDRVHVLGTGTAAAGVVARLEAAGIDVSLGPVPSGDAAAELARSDAHEVDRIEVAPFSAPSGADRAALEERVREADATVLADAVGSGRLLEAIDPSSPLVVVETRPVDERNVAGAAVRKQYETYRERAVNTTVEGVLEAVADASADRSRSQSTSPEPSED